MLLSFLMNHKPQKHRTHTMKLENKEDRISGTPYNSNQNTNRQIIINGASAMPTVTGKLQSISLLVVSH
jgi:hypothetical protein